jgi:hypothetical protein
MSELLLDAVGCRRSPATLPGFHVARPPRNKGHRCPKSAIWRPQPGRWPCVVSPTPLAPCEGQVGAWVPCMGIEATTVVPRPGALSIRKLPRTASTRSVSPPSPEPPSMLAPPMPSSRTST